MEIVDVDDDDVETKRKERGVCTTYFRKEIVTDVMDDRLHLLYKRFLLLFSSSTIKSTVSLEVFNFYFSK